MQLRILVLNNTRFHDRHGMNLILAFWIFCFIFLNIVGVLVKFQLGFYKFSRSINTGVDALGQD